MITPTIDTMVKDSKKESKNKRYTYEEVAEPQNHP
jgi:hypothetical protein